MRNAGISDKKLNNIIFLMDTIANKYISSKRLSIADFVEIDKKYGILQFIRECPDIFDSLTDEERIEEVERYIDANKK